MLLSTAAYSVYLLEHEEFKNCCKALMLEYQCIQYLAQDETALCQGRKYVVTNVLVKVCSVKEKGKK